MGTVAGTEAGEKRRAKQQETKAKLEAQSEITKWTKRLLWLNNVYIMSFWWAWEENPSQEGRTNNDRWYLIIDNFSSSTIWAPVFFSPIIFSYLETRLRWSNQFHLWWRAGSGHVSLAFPLFLLRRKHLSISRSGAFENLWFRQYPLTATLSLHQSIALDAMLPVQIYQMQNYSEQICMQSLCGV